MNIASIAAAHSRSYSWYRFQLTTAPTLASVVSEFAPSLLMYGWRIGKIAAGFLNGG